VILEAAFTIALLGVLLFVNSPPPKPEVILTNFFAEPTVLLVPITSRVNTSLQFLKIF
jgi:hypothetical protein